ncbi:MAG: hypothetical protein ACOYD0_11935, partial [Candidatus Nanopelagicales bacterium]
MDASGAARALPTTLVSGSGVVGRLFLRSTANAAAQSFYQLSFNTPSGNTFAIHLDDAHGDTGHGDTAHVDTPTVNTAHVDTAHADHTDQTAHSD